MYRTGLLDAMSSSVLVFGAGAVVGASLESRDPDRHGSRASLKSRVELYNEERVAALCVFEILIRDVCTVFARPPCTALVATINARV